MNKFEARRREIYIELEEKLNTNIINYNTNVEMYKKYKAISLYEEKVVHNADIRYFQFDRCTFKDMIFKDCKIQDSFFYGCTFDNVVFDNCTFSTLENSMVVFQNNCEFLQTTFKNSNLEKVIFVESKLQNSRFILSDMKNLIMSKVDIMSVHISDCDMRGYKLIDSDIYDLKFEDEYLTKLSEESFFDEMKFEIKNKESIKNVFKIYKEISTKFEANILPNKSGEYYYLYKKLECKTLKGLDKIKSYIYWMLCGYGEKPTYALITSIEIVLLFTILYMFAGLSIGLDVIEYDLQIIASSSIDTLILDFLRSLYFSVVTFTTVGYGDITPIGFSVLLSGIEMFLGVTMVGIWTATLARKITR